MKKKRMLPILLLIFAQLLACTASATEGRSWYIKRAVGESPTVDVSERELHSHGAIWIDRAHNEQTEEKVLYLTYDAGYINENVIRILDTMKEKNVQGAFFILAHPILHNTDTVIRMAKEGHLVCNHTKNHKSITKMSREELTKNLRDLAMIYEEKTTMTMAPYFRPPEGNYSFEALDTVRDAGYRTVFWSFAYEDWDTAREPNPTRAKEKILKNTHNGAILLLHPTSATNAAILPELIDIWREMGYRFGSLDELK
jgi:peptidoglycan-N-acetylmuramic acid deacetylase